MADAIQNVLLLCTGKSARSPFVGPLLNRAGAGRFLAHSAGSRPKGEPNPMALTVLSEHGFYTLSLPLRSWTEFSGPDAAKMDLIITVCANAAGENCTVWPGSRSRRIGGSRTPLRSRAKASTPLSRPPCTISTTGYHCCWLCVAAPFLLTNVGNLGAIISVVPGIVLVGLSLPRGERSADHYASWDKYVI